MKKSSIFFAGVVMLALCVPAMAVDRVQSGEFVVELGGSGHVKPFSVTQNPQSNGGELLENPGFETGSLTPWYSTVWEVTTTSPHTGSYCATGEGNNWVRQDFTGVPVEEVISITFWSRQPEEAIQAIDLYYSDGTYFEDIIWPTADWGFFDITSWLSPGKTLDGIRFWGYSGGGPDPDISFIDDISIEVEGQQALKVTPPEVSAWYGGTLNFELYGENLGGRDYVLLGGLTGTSPGTPLPGGQILPLNWDWFTDFLLALAMDNHPCVIDFLGTLDPDGYGSAMLVFPGHCQLYEDLIANFAWATIFPFDFVSNSVEATIQGKPQPPAAYYYDDGTTENGLGLTAGGQMCWIHWYQAVPGALTIDEIATAFGSVGGSNPPAGNAAAVYIWDDPNNDGDPTDAVLLAEVATVCTDPGTDTFHFVNIGEITVSGGFFVGAMCEQASGTYPGPMDENSGYVGHSWVVGDTTYNFDPNNLNNNDVAPVELGSIGFPANWLLRAYVKQ